MATKKRDVSKLSKTDIAYDLTIQGIFFRHYKEGIDSFIFPRSDIVEFGAADDIKAILGTPIANDGDVLYAYRFRRPLPAKIRATERDGLSWRIQLAGRSRYRFLLSKAIRIEPRESLVTVNIPDSTPEIISKYALNDEQALLAKVRYNRLIDVFLGIATYSLQNHLRTAVKGIGQIEIDELYVGIDKDGAHYVIPVQAKGGTDKLSPAQTEQDLAYCAEKFPDLKCRAVSAQFMDNDRIALFECVYQDGEIHVAEERHYKLVAADECGPAKG